MTRKYTQYAESKVVELLGMLIEASTDAIGYRRAMYELGKNMGNIIAHIGQEKHKNCELVVACTVEDADFLAKGVIDVAEDSRCFESVKVACFWNERVQGYGEIDLSAAPILKRYREPLNSNISHVLVVVKSIVASGCVVRTNITNLINESKPLAVIIAAPVMLEKADIGLKKEFSSEISDKFDFLVYAIDDEKNSKGEVLPGIGGNVYYRLGFGSQSDKNRLVPSLVKDRRKKF